MTDIIERLDDLARILQWHLVGKVVCKDAKAEIERLRAENAKLRGLLYHDYPIVAEPAQEPIPRDTISDRTSGGK